MEDYKRLTISGKVYKLIDFDKQWTYEHELEAESILEGYKNYIMEAARRSLDDKKLSQSFDLFKLVPNRKEQLTLMALIYQETNGNVKGLVDRKDKFKFMLKSEYTKAKVGMRDFFDSVGKSALEDFQTYTPSEK